MGAIIAALVALVVVALAVFGILLVVALREVGHAQVLGWIRDAIAHPAGFVRKIKRGDGF